MTWKLWLDDIRHPKVFARQQYGQDWLEEKYVWAMTIDQAIYYVKLYGPPSFMALDHDLGYDQVAMCERVVPEFLEWLQENHPESPPDYRCHTSNPEGAKNMIAFMESWKKSLTL